MEILLIANHPDELGDKLTLTDQLVSPVEGLGEGVYLVSVECDYYVYNYTLPGNGDIQSQLCILA